MLKLDKNVSFGIVQKSGMLASWSKLDCLHDKDFIFFCQLNAPAKISFWLIWVNSIKCANCNNKMEKLGYLLHRTVQLAENLLQKKVYKSHHTIDIFSSMLHIHSLLCFSDKFKLLCSDCMII